VLGEIILADYTAIFSVGDSPDGSPFKDLKFHLASSSETAQEDTAKTLDTKVSLFLHRITINQNFARPPAYLTNRTRSPFCFSTSTI
jgi:hypothetical protein